MNVALLGEEFTEAEKEAMVTIEELKLINGMDLAAVLLRGKILRRIEEKKHVVISPCKLQYASGNGKRSRHLDIQSLEYSRFELRDIPLDGRTRYFNP